MSQPDEILPSSAKPEKKPDTRFYERWNKAESGVTGLSVRIFAVNIFVIVLLAFGIFYFTQYRESLIRTELESLTTEALLFSTTLSKTDFADKKELERTLSLFSRTTKDHVHLYDIEGKVILETDHDADNKDDIFDEENHFPRTIDDLFKEMVDLIPVYYDLPKYPKENYNDIKDHPDAILALQGKNNIHAWKKEDGSGIVLTAAAPVWKKGEIQAILHLTKDNTELEEAVTKTRSELLTLFLAVSLFTLILSFYLTNFIAHPLKKLAMAAEAVRLGQEGKEIPDLSHRKDEMGALSVALRSMTRALKDRMDSIEHFAADVAHELKNPLTSLKSAVETAQKIKDEKKIRMLLDIINHDVERLDRLITDISASSRLDAELPRDTVAKVNLNTFFSHLLSAYKKEEKNRVILSIDDHKTLYTIGNEGRLAQVFHNLIDNALSFSPDGKDVDVRIKRENDSIIVYVEDEGSGILGQKSKKVFERFYTERPQTETFGQHSGLGLSIAKQIIDSHGGTILAENIKNADGTIKGARFTVTLKTAS